MIRNGDSIIKMLAKDRLNSLEKTNDGNDTNKAIEWSVKYQVLSSHTSFFAS